MSPESTKHFDISITIEDAVELKLDKERVGIITTPTSVEEAVDELTSKYFMSTEELVDLLMADKWAVNVFKEAWHDPDYELDSFDELVFNKVMESELGRS